MGFTGPARPSRPTILKFRKTHISVAVMCGWLTTISNLPGRRSPPWRHAGVIHMVGGGVRNHLLCQLTADACGLPVIAGPVEAAALGNALDPARGLGAAPGA